MNLKSTIEDIIHSKPITVVYPREFFIFWNGVPALAYQGFTPTLLKIKEEIDELVKGLKSENPGSKWPKTTLGAIQDNKNLNREDFNILHAICDKMNLKLDKNKCIDIDELSVVLFKCRSLEERLITYTIKLDSNQNRDLAAPPLGHENDVAQAMDDLSSNKLDAFGNAKFNQENKEIYYREPHIEATLVFDLPAPEQQPALIQEFIDAINKELPDLFYWFSPESRHMTVRALST